MLGTQRSQDGFSRSERVQVRIQRVRERLEWQRPLELVAECPQHARAGRLGIGGPGLEKPALANAGLAFDHHQLDPASRCPFQGRIERRQLAVSPGQDRPYRRRRGLPAWRCLQLAADRFLAQDAQVDRLGFGRRVHSKLLAQSFPGTTVCSDGQSRPPRRRMRLHQYTQRCFVVRVAFEH